MGQLSHTNNLKFPRVEIPLPSCPRDTPSTRTPHGPWPPARCNGPHTPHDPFLHRTLLARKPRPASGSVPTHASPFACGELLGKHNSKPYDYGTTFQRACRGRINENAKNRLAARARRGSAACPRLPPRSTRQDISGLSNSQVYHTSCRRAVLLSSTHSPTALASIKSQYQEAVGPSRCATSEGQLRTEDRRGRRSSTPLMIMHRIQIYQLLCARIPGA